jgi:hypothetical protein
MARKYSFATNAERIASVSGFLCQKIWYIEKICEKIH